MTPEILGLIPAAGRATRLGSAVVGSKELIPIPRLGLWRGLDGAGEPRPRPVIAHLLDAMGLAGIARATIVHRREKTDVAATLGDGAALGAGVPLEYLPITSSGSVPETLSYAIHPTESRAIAVGFPDVLAEPVDALAALVRRYRERPVHALLGLFPTDRPDKADLVDWNASTGEVHGIAHKPGFDRVPSAGAPLTWLLLVGSPAFAQRLVRFVREGRGPQDREPQLSDVLVEAIREGERVEALAFPEGSHLDVGTPEDLARACSTR